MSMNQLIEFTKKNYFFPLVALCYGAFYILLGEQYPFHNGVNTDGYVFLDLIRNSNNSHYFDTFYIQRIFPLLIAKYLTLLTGGDLLSDVDIVLSFKIINIVSLTTTCYLLKRIFIILKVTHKHQLFFFVLFFFNFGVCKFHFYFPAMTDQTAMMLSVALLFFYLKNNTSAIILCTLASAFTWPTAYYIGLILIAIPIQPIAYSIVSNNTKKIIQGVFVGSILCIISLVVFVLKMSVVPNIFVSDIDRRPAVLLLSIAGVAVLYFFFSKLLINKTLWDISLFIKKLNYNRLLLAVGTFLIVYLIITLLHPAPARLYSLGYALSRPMLYPLIKPLLTIVADVSYFGVFVCILILFWSSLCKTISQMGWGITAAVVFNIYLFGADIETRHLINLLPWLVVFLAKAVDKYSFSKRFYITATILAFIVSKFWLKLNLYDYFGWGETDENGNLGFPDQILWMNLGPWMNTQMYYVQGGITIILFAILFFTLYKVERNNEGKLQVIKIF